jgi:4-aminobutyrate aminotransferase-like enzyme/Ser/Thr protein kinase RdoA (MazF antagonist)
MTVSAKSLFSDIGQNFLLTDSSGQQFVLKIANPQEQRSMIDAQNSCMDFLNKQNHQIVYPSVLSNKMGEKNSDLIDRNSAYLARMITFIPGTFLADIAQPPRELLHKFGSALGIMNKSLFNFDHPGVHRYWHWDLNNALDIQNHTAVIQDAGKRRLVDYFFLQFETDIRPLIPMLRKSVIHNDVNDHNILVRENQTIGGIIDFGDMVYSSTINELAIACAYVMFDKSDPLQAAAPVISGYNEVIPLEPREVDILFYLIVTRLCMSVTITAIQQHDRPENQYLSISEQQAWDLLENCLAINPRKAANIFRETCKIPDTCDHETINNRILTQRSIYLGNSLSISYQRPLHIIRGAMQYLFDTSGHTYLDCVNNVCHVGHCHPHVVKAARKQMTHLNTNTRYLHPNIIEYAQRLADKMPDPLQVCFFVNSGSEANELALRLAMAHTHQQDFIVLDNAYHGHTIALINVSPYKFNGPGGRGQKPHIHKVKMPDLYRGPYRTSDANAGLNYAREIQTTIELIRKKDTKPAAFICESLMGCGGQIVFPGGYLKNAYQFVHDAGGVFIADEVQVGFGRVGSHFWGFETQGIIPDIVTLGKPIGNGHPLAAVVTTPEIAESFDNGMEYFNTFGGNPVSCAIGMAVLDVIENEHLQHHAATTGQKLINEFNTLKEKYFMIGDVRGMGLFIGIELVTNSESLAPATKEARFIVEKMRENGILLSIDGPLHNVIKIKPPLVFNDKNVDFVINTIENILDKYLELKLKSHWKANEQ